MRLRYVPLACAAVLLAALPAAASAPRSGWSIQPSPNPTGAKTSGLSGVSCTSASACTAVGGFGRGALAERWDGSTWAIQHTPKHFNRDALSDVSCPSARVCVAVGESFDNVRGTALVERWNGRRWRIQSTPVTDVSGLSGVSCSSPTACVAVGDSFPHRTERVLILRWNGHRWSIQQAPVVRDGQLNDVSCTSARACTAVGVPWYRRGPLVERWNGRTWSVQPTPRLSVVDVGLDSVSCTSATLCTAVGTITEPPPCESTGCGENLKTRTLAERWNGVRWSVQRSRNPTHHSSLSGVSCTSARACTAVGGDPGLMAERWNGRSWTVQHLPGVPGRPGKLGGVLCLTNQSCLAVGATSGYGGHTLWARTLVERWTG